MTAPLKPLNPVTETVYVAEAPGITEAVVGGVTLTTKSGAGACPNATACMTQFVLVPRVAVASIHARWLVNAMLHTVAGRSNGHGREVVPGAVTVPPMLAPIIRSLGSIVEMGPLSIAVPVPAVSAACVQRMLPCQVRCIRECAHRGTAATLNVTVTVLLPAAAATMFLA